MSNNLQRLCKITINSINSIKGERACSIKNLKIQFSKQLYISGMRALNINDYEYFTGDWHVQETWHNCSNLSPFHIMGKGKFALMDTNLYLGEEGVFEASETLKTMGIQLTSGLCSDTRKSHC